MRVSIMLLIVLMVVLLPPVAHQQIAPAKASLVISGEIIDVGEPPKSDSFPFQLMKYRVRDVCQGEYDQKEIAIYHMVSTAGLADVKAGDEICVGALKSFKIEENTTEDSSEKPETQYLSVDVFIRRCRCSSR
jgi:hypothetical protein